MVRKNSLPAIVCGNDLFGRSVRQQSDLPLVKTITSILRTSTHSGKVVGIVGVFLMQPFDLLVNHILPEIDHFRQCLGANGVSCQKFGGGGRNRVSRPPALDY